MLQMQEVAGKQVFNGDGWIQKNEEFILPTQMPEPCQFQQFSFVHAAEKYKSHSAVSVNPTPQVKSVSVQAVHPAMKTVDPVQRGEKLP
ncbi:hypothetical protein DAMNIGENAA_05230 [Desulforhabdus amnigena]|uniref:Uncharacterized protein n=1 Tax=Desulforhabdus amnigena TaxID=40218 RepID=A0A9W6CZL9_9BACT|nr:hypothetical protein DAMNIGENAA_05230 [Desulforhabdus amnigena]